MYFYVSDKFKLSFKFLVYKVARGRGNLTPNITRFIKKAIITRVKSDGGERLQSGTYDKYTNAKVNHC